MVLVAEYFRDAEVSEKVDVYSFGVVLLELITGQKPHNAGTEPGIGLARWASQQYRNKIRWDHIIDKDIQNQTFLEDMKAVFKLGLSCTSEDPLDRPAMHEVLQELSRYDRSRVKHRGKKGTTESFGAKVYRNIRDKIFRRG
jgi:serine/threonine protein kinase